MQPPAKKPRKPKQYIPAHRSGAYALILALSSVPRESLQSLTKAELQELAQPHCDSSFTAPSDPSKFYTAWNSMNTLVDKYLVHERGRPTRRYALTDEGWELAEKMLKVRKVAQVEVNGTNGPQVSEQQDRATSTGSASRENTDMRSDEEEQVNAKCSSLRPADIVRDHWAKKQGNAATQGLKSGSAEQPRAQARKTSSRSVAPRGDLVDLLSSPEPEFSFTKMSTNESNSISQQAHEGIQIISTLHTTYPVPTLPEFEPITIPAGSFSVQLVLDNREVRAKSDRDYISEELSKKGIKPLMRSLELGDFFWVAKLNDPQFFSRNGEEGDELALDWVIERKRLDDLVSSITDGRFQEQKFRLRKSGANHVIYLIEQFSLSEEKSTRFHEAIRTAIASTQVVNGYFVKQTQKLDDTIHYITRMTFMLKSLYESKPLYLIPTKVLTPLNYLPLLKHLQADSERRFHITYPSFASLSSKSDTMTLRDVFLKMLMCTRGISGEKALAVQKAWNTPRELVEAFERCSDPKEKDRLVESRLGNLVGRNKIKGILSAKIADIWGVA